MKNENNWNKRLKRERITVEKMIHIYCSDEHGLKNELCLDCRALLKYSEARLQSCPFGEGKPVCPNCTIHCYSQAMREKVKTVMRFSGPRMLLKHPYLAIMHMFDEKIIKPVMFRTKAG